MKKKSKKDSKTDDEKFVDWLKPSEKEYTVFDCKEYESVGNWNGRVYHKKLNIFERVLVKLLNKYAPRPNLDSRLDQ